jgi:D-alanyl-lipoteichoic acid acyltransferase DltB (MBOAT superfamily)
MGLIFAIIINFTLIGIWHGANWTFVLFGFLHGCFYIPLIVKGTLNKKSQKTKGYPSFIDICNILITFITVMLAFVIFRANSVMDALNIFVRIGSVSIINFPELEFVKLAFLSIALLTIEWFGKQKEYAIANIGAKYPKPVRWAIYYVFVLVVLCLAGKEQQFLYFKF